jgi:hypothetical protein
MMSDQFTRFGGHKALDMDGWDVQFDLVVPGVMFSGRIRKGDLLYGFDANIMPTGQEIPGVDAGFEAMNAPSAYLLDHSPDLYRELYDHLMRAAFSPTWYFKGKEQ